MLLVQEHLIKLGGVKLSGQMKSIDISEVATIENIEDDKGKTKANQPTGYEAAKISIEFILEDSKKMTQIEQISAMQRLFKPYKQKKAKLLKVVNEASQKCILRSSAQKMKWLKVKGLLRWSCLLQR